MRCDGFSVLLQAFTVNLFVRWAWAIVSLRPILEFAQAHPLQSCISVIWIITWCCCLLQKLSEISSRTEQQSSDQAIRSGMSGSLFYVWGRSSAPSTDAQRQFLRIAARSRSETWNDVSLCDGFHDESFRTVVRSSNTKRHVWESILCSTSIVSTEHCCAATISQHRSKISVWNLEWREPKWRFPRGKFRNGRPITQSELACLGCYFTFDL